MDWYRRLNAHSARRNAMTPTVGESLRRAWAQARSAPVTEEQLRGEIAAVLADNNLDRPEIWAQRNAQDVLVVLRRLGVSPRS